MRSLGTILVAEDETDILEVLEYNLTRAGYNVICSQDGQDGIRRARADLPDLILLDLMLPHIGGVGVCRMLKADTRTRTILIIMVTAKGEDRDVAAGLSAGADDYVTKPFSPKNLLALVRTYMHDVSTPRATTSDGAGIFTGS